MAIDSTPDERTLERFAFLYGAVLSLANNRNPEALNILRKYHSIFEPSCNGILVIRGEAFHCEQPLGHAEDMPHANKRAEAVWGLSSLG